MLNRRQGLRMLAGSLISLPSGELFSKLFAESTVASQRAAAPCDTTHSEAERLLAANLPVSGVTMHRITYTASATVMLFSIPIVSRGGVGSGYAMVEEGACRGGTCVSIQFGAGSWPEAARGLNRFGLIQELALEKPDGTGECAYFAFMTASPEKDISQGKAALAVSGDVLTCTAAQGHGRGDSFSSRVEPVELPSRLTWRNADELTTRVRDAISNSICPASRESAERGVAATFLYRLRRAMLDPKETTQSALFFNSKQYLLDTRKQSDTAAGTALAARSVTSKPDRVMRLNATLTNRATGHVTPFHLWYEAGAEDGPPLRFEYLAKPFLRLTFEADPAAPAPPVTPVLKERQA